MAVVAMRPINKTTTAAEPLVHQFAVNLGTDVLAWSGNLRAGDAAIQVAAGIRCCGVVLNLIEWKTDAVCHAFAG